MLGCKYEINNLRNVVEVVGTTQSVPKRMDEKLFRQYDAECVG